MIGCELSPFFGTLNKRDRLVQFFDRLGIVISVSEADVVPSCLGRLSEIRTKLRKVRQSLGASSIEDQSCKRSTGAAF